MSMRRDGQPEWRELQMTTDTDASTLPDDWAEALRKREYDLDRLTSLIADIYDAANPAVVFPPRSDVFRAFHLTKLKDVRVVILGQDPYPQPGQAHGLAFSVPEPVPIPRSLSAVFKNLERDREAGAPFIRPANGDLSAWAKQGVLLLNTALTVGQRNAGSHSGLWRAFTDLVLEVVSEEHDHVAFLLWGKHAIDRASAVGITEPPHMIVKSAHPAARGRTKQKPFKDGHPFTAANAFLTAHGSSPVEWDLAALTPQQD